MSIPEWKNITFHQWLNSYESITKQEYKRMSESSKEKYRRAYDTWKKES